MKIYYVKNQFGWAYWIAQNDKFYMLYNYQGAGLLKGQEYFTKDLPHGLKETNHTLEEIKAMLL